MKPKALALVVILVLLIGGGGLLYRMRSGSEPVAASIQASVSQSKPLAGEKVKISGELETGRPVQLQVRQAEKWAEQSSATADDGTISFSVAATSTPTEYRLFAPKAEIDGESHPPGRSKKVTVVAIKQTASLALKPPIAQSRSGTEDLSPGVATFTPARAGAEVSIQRRRDGDWSTVASGEQDKDGAFAFVIDAGPTDKPYQLRAMTELPGAEPLISPETTATQWKQVFADGFEGDELGPEWQLRPSGIPAGRPVCETTEIGRINVGGGTANLSLDINKAKVPNVTKDCPDGQFSQAMVGTQASKTFTFGIFAARVRYHDTRGAHGSFWMQTAQPTDPDDPHSGTEIDVTEYFGDGYRDGGLANFVYYPKREPDGTVKQVKLGGLTPEKTVEILGEGNDASDDFHVYSVEWTPEEYIFRLDGVETQRLDTGVSHRPEFLVMSLLTRDWESDNLDKDKLPLSMKVDWVRAWQK